MRLDITFFQTIRFVETKLRLMRVFCYRIEYILIHLSISELFSVAFRAVVDGHPVIDKGTNVKFNLITLNDGNGY